ncbi:TPA: helix-turn-helix transcriptional regulator [Clostridium botulinum]|nr:XRE family transcriptional regulator [Clostridium botulinum]NFB61542.1 XRE family transcriptional regulator [Clostridium botulinum]HCL4448285.1 helix-turn-helix transcriptional regulator [Clostridium botulinum]HCL4459394.1 helix-turn-helix transcriptional regulator [Clostridium botulinum]HCL4463144.1 helix-turn-helix transcriptional regulator [Clostridium botulinum]
MKIKIERIKKGLTQTELRKKLKLEYSIGMSPNKIVAIEKGDYTGLRYCEIVAISKILEVSPEELFF